MSTTERMAAAFTVKEFADGTPFIMAEPRSGGLQTLDGGFFAFDLPPGADEKKAREVAAYLNANVAGIAVTIV